MAAIIATVSATVAIFGGAQLSRPAFSDDHLKQHRLDNAAAMIGAVGFRDAKQQPEQPATARSSPIELVEGRQPSLVDLLHCKWFGSVSSDGSSGAGSRFHDSATSMSPPEQRRQQRRMAPDGAAAAINEDFAAATKSTQQQQPPQLASRAVASGGTASAGNSNSSHASSCSRQIASVVPGGHKRSTLPQLPPASTSDPTTPDWMSQATDVTGDVSTLESETPILTRACSSDNLGALDCLASLERSRRGGKAAAEALTRTHGADLFGTWAHRQKHFLQQPSAEPQPDAAEAGVSADLTNGAAAVVAAENGGADAQQLAPIVAPHERARREQAAAAVRAATSDTDQDDDDRVREKAWRWRFGRRWAAEQAKQFDPEYGRQVGDEDGWDEALGYLENCGGGIHLQIGRTVSIDKTLNRASLNRDGSATFLLDADSLQDEGPLARESTDDYYGATRSLGAKAKKAQELLRRQKDIDADVSRQWGDARAAGTSWAGQYLPAVLIDMHGRFPFVLLRAADRSGMHKLLVRGRNGATHAQLLQAAKLESTQQSRTRQVPAASLEIIGSGIMQWSRDRDRCVNVSDGRVAKGSDSSVRSNPDAARLAGALTSCSLPINYHVTVEGQRLM